MRAIVERFRRQQGQGGGIHFQDRFLFKPGGADVIGGEQTIRRGIVAQREHFVACELAHGRFPICMVNLVPGFAISTQWRDGTPGPPELLFAEGVEGDDLAGRLVVAGAVGLIRQARFHDNLAVLALAGFVRHIELQSEVDRRVGK